LDRSRCSQIAYAFLKLDLASHHAAGVASGACFAEAAL